MKCFIYYLSIILISSQIFFNLKAFAQVNFESNTLYDTISLTNLQVKEINQLFENSGYADIHLTEETVSGISINGEAELLSNKSYVRIILLDDKGKEYLLYEYSCKREVTMYKKWQIRMYKKQQLRMSIFSI